MQLDVFDVINMDVHKCGDCQKVFNSYETFLIHKLLVEQYKLTLETSVRIPGLRLPKFIKINQPPKPSATTDEPLPVTDPMTTKENGKAETSTDSGTPFAAELSPIMDTACSPVVEIVVDTSNSGDDVVYSETVNDSVVTHEVVSDDVLKDETVSDDDNSVGSQPESLRIDEGRGVKESSPASDAVTELENDLKKEYYCKECKRHYKSKVVLRVHEETVHSSCRPFVCTSCRLGFKTKGSLIRHIRTHTGERPFSCGQCRRAFSDSGTLARHVHRVHKKRPFKQANDVKVVITRLKPETENVRTRETLGT